MNQEHIEIIMAALEEYAFVREAHYDGLPAALADAQAARQVMTALRQPPTAPQPLLCERCNDYLEAPSYCEICYGTIESAFREADARATPQPHPEGSRPSVPSDTRKTLEVTLYYTRATVKNYWHAWAGDASESDSLEKIDAALSWLDAQPSTPA